MADTSSVKEKRLKLQMREILSNAYSFVRGRQYTETIANITYEELLDKAIDRIEGTSGRSDVRSTILDRVEKIKSEIGNAITTVKKQPASAWTLSTESDASSSSSSTETAQDAMNTEE